MIAKQQQSVKEEEKASKGSSPKTYKTQETRYTDLGPGEGHLAVSKLDIVPDAQ